MKTIILQNDIEVVCIQALSFPDGISAAHQQLKALFPPSATRRYFGISYPQQGSIIYLAATESFDTEKTSILVNQRFSIRKGTYACITLFDYYKDLPNITTTFQQLLSHPNLDPTGYCLEWYLSDKDVRCMVRIID